MTIPTIATAHSHGVGVERLGARAAAVRAVVVTPTSNVQVVVGLNGHAATGRKRTSRAGGASVQVRVAVPKNPLPPMERKLVAFCPAGTLAEPEFPGCCPHRSKVPILQCWIKPAFADCRTHGCPQRSRSPLVHRMFLIFIE